MVAEDGDTAALHYRKIYILPLIAQHNGFFDGYERLPGKIPNRITSIIPNIFSSNTPNRITSIIPNRFPGKIPNRFPGETPNRFPSKIPNRFPGKTPGRSSQSAEQTQQTQQHPIYPRTIHNPQVTPPSTHRRRHRRHIQ